MSQRSLLSILAPAASTPDDKLEAFLAPLRDSISASRRAALETGVISEIEAQWCFALDAKHTLLAVTGASLARHVRAAPERGPAIADAAPHVRRTIADSVHALLNGDAAALAVAQPLRLLGLALAAELLGETSLSDVLRAILVRLDDAGRRQVQSAARDVCAAIEGVVRGQ